MKVKRTGTSRIVHTFPLEPDGIDLCSEALEYHLTALGVERQNQIRIRLSIEESLLRLRDHFGEDKSFRLIVGKSLGKPYLQVELEGDIYNPLSKTEARLEDWSGSLLTAVGLSPLYSYSRGRNILRVNLARKSMNSALKILIAVLIGLGIGLLLNFMLAPDARLQLSSGLLDPLYEFWIRVLSVMSGPVIFLMVCTAVLNTGMIEEEGGSSRAVFMRYFLLSLAAALIAVHVSCIVLGEPVSTDGLGLHPGEYYRFILRLMPRNLVSPLMDSNTPQILILAFVLGNMILVIDSKSNGIGTLVRQGNMMGLLLTDLVSCSVPFFAASLICMEILEESFRTFFGMWVFLILAVAVSACFVAVILIYTARKENIPVRLLFGKVWPSFFLTLKTGSIDEGYGLMEQKAVHELGLEKHFASVSLPYGLVLYMPVNVIGTLMFTLFAASRYQAVITIGWLAEAMVLSVILFVATPPVPGANLLAYIMIFAQLGIPSEALIDAMIFDILFGIFASAANQTLLQFDLLLQADKIGLLDKEKLLAD